MLADPAPQKLVQGCTDCFATCTMSQVFKISRCINWSGGILKEFSSKKEVILKQIYKNIYLLPKGQNLSTALVTEVLVRRFSGGSVYAERVNETENVF